MAKKRKIRKRKPHVVLPLKNPILIKEVENCLKTHFRVGERNYMIFQTGKATLLRVSDVLNLKKSDVYVFDELEQTFTRKCKTHAYTVDIKTGKRNVLYIKPIEKDLLNYFDWLEQWELKKGTCVFTSPWLFPNFTSPDKPISTHRYYMAMQKVGKILGIKSLGTHTMRKTGAFLVYQQTKNLPLVTKLLNHSSEKTTLRYLGLERKNIDSALDHIKFY